MRLHDFQALRTLVAMSWVVASYVFTLGETLNTPEVRLLAHLGGYVPHKNRAPGKKTLLLGLQRLAAAYLTTQTARQWGQDVSGNVVLDRFWVGVEFCPVLNNHRSGAGLLTCTTRQVEADVVSLHLTVIHYDAKFGGKHSAQHIVQPAHSPR